MIHWNPSPDIVTIGPLHIRWYSMMFLIGFTTAYQMFVWYCKREKKPQAALDSLLIYSFVGCTIGARLGHCLFYEPDYFLSSWDHALEILMIWRGGLASHGGTVGVMIALWLFTRKHRDFSYMWLLDHAIIPVAFTAGLIRLGNMMNSEIVGSPTTVPWAIIFDRVDQVPRHPAQLYESITYFILFAITLTMYRRRKDLPGGLIFGISMIWIYLSRIVWEYFKQNQVAFENGMAMNMGQILSFPFVAMGIWFVWRALRQPAVGQPSPKTIVTE